MSYPFVILYDSEDRGTLHRVHPRAEWLTACEKPVIGGEYASEVPAVFPGALDFCPKCFPPKEA
jgi:hypothetical protein